MNVLWSEPRWEANERINSNFEHGHWFGLFIVSITNWTFAQPSHHVKLFASLHKNEKNIKLIQHESSDHMNENVEMKNILANENDFVQKNSNSESAVNQNLL